MENKNQNENLNESQYLISVGTSLGGVLGFLD